MGPMGFFTYAYILDASEDGAGLHLSRSIYTSRLRPAGRSLFSWDVGERPPGMHAYANGTLFSSDALELLPGYPLMRTISSDEGTDSLLIEEGFLPSDQSAPVLFHLLLPERYVPRPNREPLQQPSQPNVLLLGDRLLISYASPVAGEIRFWIEKLQNNERMTDFDLTRILKAPSSSVVKASVELNFGIIKISLGT